jgi:Rrf2 family protein
MFRINRKTDYSVRVMLCLARRPFGARLSTQAIQNEMLVPRPYLQRIVADLSRAGLIRTFPGTNGGLELARPPYAITLRHIWEAAEGILLISDCLRAPGVCPLGEGCSVQTRWGRLQAMMVRELESTTLEQLALEANELVALPAGKEVEKALVASAD